jgi:hypothetical protein
MPEGEVRIRISARDDATKAMSAVRQAVTSLIKAWLGFQGVRKVMQEFREIITGFVDYTEKIDKAYKITGIATDTLQRLAYAAEQEHASFELVNNSLKFLVRNMTSVQDGLAESKRAFDRIGVAALDSQGNLRNVEDVFYEVAEAIRNAGSDTEAMSIALDLFGRSGSEIIPLTKLGSQGLKDLGDQAARMGRVLSHETIVQGKAFSDELTRINAEVQSLKLYLATEMLPTLQSMTGHVRDLVAVYQKLSGVYKTITEFGGQLNAMYFMSGKYLGPLINLILGKGEAQKREWNILKDLTELSEKQIAQIKKQIDAYKAWLSEVKTFDEWLSEVEQRDALKMTRAEFIALEERLKAINQIIPEFAQHISEISPEPLRIGILQPAEEITDQFADMKDAVIQYGHAFLDNVVDAFVEGRVAWNQLVVDFMKSIVKMIAKMLILKAISAAFKAPIPGFAQGGVLPHMQSGGVIPGGPPYSDRMLFAGMPGEGVVNRLGMQTLGREGLDRLNRGQSISNKFDVNIVIQGNADPNTVRSIENMLRLKLPAMIKDAERRRQI